MRTDDRVWYVAYGSNLHADRFRCYLTGGCPPGAARNYVGGRDPSHPRAATRVRLPGGLLFAGRSRVWGGGIAVYDPTAPGRLAARAYLLTFGQFSDVVAQETHRTPGRDLDLGDSAVTTSSLYDRVLEVGPHEGIPMLTLTTRRTLDPAPPTAPYLRMVLEGLAQTFGWSVGRRVDYLLRARGVSQAWARETLTALASDRSNGLRAGPAALPQSQRRPTVSSSSPPPRRRTASSNSSSICGFGR